MRPTKEMDMKKLLLALAALTAISTVSAYAYTCRTQCYWVGQQQWCTERCNAY
jgi:hypothetical protein